ncbi:hypothetical protein [Halomonas sp. N3-2A]|uniref:hypothetical protein n=1 Tax=Halomonas sp. N3-2A TaxID=2014541 RepID=UPI000B5B275C|nr:hypothetical protein [Halomonas sp. N3-2A]ASK18377.1 hypothetical protein CEK60_03230 [Halomonas sp. N3-2A]
MNLCLEDTNSVIDWLCDGKSPVTASISIAKLSATLSKALEMDGLSHKLGDVLEILLAPIEERRAVPDRADASIDAGDVFLHGSDWTVSIAEHFGFQGASEDFVDLEWLKDRPHTKAVHKAITMLAVEAMSTASDFYREKNGHSMMDVLMVSMDTGEGFDQTQARLTAKTKGLEVVK